MYALVIGAILTVFDSGMSAEEMKQTGVGKLNSQEKEALQTWIDKNYSKKTPAKQPKTILQENLKNGSFIRLSDDSLWEIDPVDTPITQGWITPVEVKVAPSNNQAYPYILTNTLTGSTVKARKSEKK